MATANQVVAAGGEPNFPISHGLTGDQLIEWWVNKARQDAELTIPKALEYGSSDLLAMGVSIMPNGTDAQRIQAAIAFYASGKSARIIGAHAEGREAKPDSWFDLTVYSMMGRHVQEFGRWV